MRGEAARHAGFVAVSFFVGVPAGCVDRGAVRCVRGKLIAMVYADMVGYSRLIALDEAGTLERLRSLRRNVIDGAASVSFEQSRA